MHCPDESKWTPEQKPALPRFLRGAHFASPASAARRPDRAARHAGGFTLIEVVLVVVLTGILAVIALPRLSTDPFSRYGYAEEVASMLRYVRQTAVARNGVLAVQLTSNGFSVACGTVCTDAENNAGGNLLNPANSRPWNGSAPAQGQAPAGVVITAPGNGFPIDLTFNGLGQPSAGIALTIGGTHTITVQAETGHVSLQ